MNLPTEVFGQVVVVHAPEELSADTSEAFERFLAELERVQVVLDLDGAETFDSRGLESLLNSQDTLREVGGDLKIAATNAANRKILELSRLDASLEVFESVVEAVKSYR